MSDTLTNLHKKFCKEYFEINFKMFYQLKPFWIVKLKISALETCLCKEHENFNLMFRKLQQHKLVKSKNVTAFIDALCCDSKNKDCMLRDCDKCGDLQVINPELEDTTTYQAWVTEKVTRLGAKGLIYQPKITFKKKIEISLSDLVQKFNDSLKKFLAHVYKVHHQSKEIKEIKEKMPSKLLI